MDVNNNTLLKRLLGITTLVQVERRFQVSKNGTFTWLEPPRQILMPTDHVRWWLGYVRVVVDDPVLPDWMQR